MLSFRRNINEVYIYSDCSRYKKRLVRKSNQPFNFFNIIIHYSSLQVRFLPLPRNHVFQSHMGLDEIISYSLLLRGWDDLFNFQSRSTSLSSTILSRRKLLGLKYQDVEALIDTNKMYVCSNKQQLNSGSRTQHIFKR